MTDRELIVAMAADGIVEILGPNEPPEAEVMTDEQYDAVKSRINQAADELVKLAVSVLEAGME